MESAWKNTDNAKNFKYHETIVSLTDFFFQFLIILPDKISRVFFLSFNILYVLLYQMLDSLSSSGCGQGPITHNKLVIWSSAVRKIPT